MRGLRQYAKAVSFKDGLRFRRGQKCKILRRVRLCVLSHRHRINDRRVRVVWKHADDLDARIDFRVGFIDDAEWRLAASDQDQRRPHVFGREGKWAIYAQNKIAVSDRMPTLRWIALLAVTLRFNPTPARRGRIAAPPVSRGASSARRIWSRPPARAQRRRWQKAGSFARRWRAVSSASAPNPIPVRRTIPHAGPSWQDCGAAGPVQK
jgi:hypothetical protein